MVHQLEAILLTLVTFKVIPYYKRLKCEFSYSCAAFDNISTDMVRRAVPLR